MRVVVLLGAPGSGKGTAAVRLAALRQARHVSSGDLLRAAVRAGDVAGLEADGYMQRGELVPDDLVAGVVARHLRLGAPAGEVLLDGFPRDVRQAELLATELERTQSRVHLAIMLDAPPELLIERLGGRRVCPRCAAGYHARAMPPAVADICDRCGTGLIVRDDDRPETVRRRLAIFNEKNGPLLAWYDARHLLRRIDGAGTADEVVARISEALAP